MMNKFIVRKNEERQIVIDRPGEYVVELAGEGARVEVLGALVAKGSERLVVDITALHRVPHTSCDIFIRAVASDRSLVTLFGMIKIGRGAQQTNAFLRENVLLVSPRARAEALPRLEIEADDVHASHAATVGKIDEEQIFYLRSRGFSRTSASKMIVDGFLNAVRERIKSHG